VGHGLHPTTRDVLISVEESVVLLHIAVREEHSVDVVNERLGVGRREQRHDRKEQKRSKYSMRDRDRTLRD
jgi:hypothetical protein